MFEPAEILSLFEARRKELGLSQAQLGELAFGKPDNTPIQSLKKGSSPGIDRVAALASALNLELYLGPPREIGPVEQILINGTDFAPVPRLDARLSAGPGALNGETEVVETLAFRRDWLEKMHIPPSKAVLVNVVGNSMQPGLHDGDLAMVDTSRTVVRSGQVYAFSDIDNQTLVKRIDLLPDHGLILRSDNPDFAPVPRLGDDANRIKVHGQVVWSGHVWK